MAEEKHSMLFQGQDPSEDLQVQRPMSLSPSEPPTYDDAMHQASLDQHTDGRRTLFAEPQHRSSRVEEMPMPHMEDDVSVQSVGSSVPVPHAVPPVRNFLVLGPQPKLGKEAMDIVCPACGQRGLTRLKRSPNGRTNLWALCLCAFGWCCCACLCPYLWNGCRTTHHYCAACEIFLGAHYPRSCCCRRL